MKTVSYGEFGHRLRAEFGQRHLPAKGTIEVTRRCPLSCAHCYNNLPMGDAGARQAELSLEEHRRLLDDLTDAGTMWLLYTGGEIFARADFLDIYKAAKQKGMLVTLFTNGTLLTPRIADELAEYRPFSIEITLYGHTQETYERLTGVPGSHARCRRGIELLLERGLPLKLKTVGVSTNRHEIPAMAQYAADLGLSFKFDSLINPRLDSSLAPTAVRLTPTEIVALDLVDPRRVEAWQELAERSREAVRSPKVMENVYSCGGGVNSFAIDPYGNLSICVLSERDKYDLRRGSFEDGWMHFLRKVREQRRTRVTKCTECGLKSLCGMCPANGELENRDKEEPVDFLCHVAHLRAEAFGIEIPPHGDCEYCSGGSLRGVIETELPALRDQVAAVTRPSADALFPMVKAKSACASGGCSACG